MSLSLNEPLPASASVNTLGGPSRLPRDLLIVAAIALAARLAFTVFIGGTYDYDEFVILLLGRDLSHGAIPYHTFMFFHPPGILVVIQMLQPLISSWWPTARLLSVVVDTGTAILVWVIGRTLFDRRTALAAGLLYALSPLALISSARIGQDPVITFLGIGGLALLVRLRGAWPALAAGALLGLALWVKYPAAYFLPVYLLAAPRRAGYILVAAAASFGLLLVPFHDQWRLMYEQTVTFQRTRWAMQTSVRVETLLVYWLVLNVPALIGLWWTRRPVWLVAGFCLGAVFVLPTQVYYHYFVPIVPFAALLGARSVAALVRWNPPRVAMAAALVLGVWAAIINLGGSSPLFVTAARFSSIQPTLSLLRTHTHAHQPVLADRFEYAYLAGRPALRHYFWNVGVLVRARYLERKMYRSGAVILSHGASSGYPAGFLGWLNKHYRHVETPATTIWLTQKRAG